MNFKRTETHRVEEYFKQNEDSIIKDGNFHTVYINGYTNGVYYKVRYVYSELLDTLVYDDDIRLYSDDNIPF